MAVVAGLLLALLNEKADLNNNTALQLYYNRLYKSYDEKVTNYTNYEEKWYDAYDKACAAESDIKMNGSVYIEKDKCNQTAKAKIYADYKVPQYASLLKSDETLDELEDLDNMYDSLQTLYATKIEENNAAIESITAQLQTNASKTEKLDGE